MFSIAPAVSEIDLPALPADEYEALRMLDERILDSAVWRKIEPYYTMPIRVPQGELRILQDYFQELPSNLPCLPDELSIYMPWDAEAVRRFFSDFPELTPFKPILSFEYGPAVTFPGQAGFYFSRRGAADTARQYALFSVGKPAGISAGGRVDFTDAYGRWFRRFVSVALSSGTRVACGNFSPIRRTPLFNGYFPPCGNTDTAVARNWLYGTAKTWNGLAVTINRTPEKNGGYIADAEALVHMGHSENIGQLSSTISLYRNISLFGGISYLHTMNIDGPDMDFGFLHAGIGFSPATQWECEIQGSVNLENPGAIPWLATLSHSAIESNFKATLIGMPRQYTAPRSETAHLLRTRAKKDSSSGYLVNSDLSFRRRLTEFLSFAPHLNFLMNNGRPCHVSVGIEMSGRPRFGYRLSYSWAPLFHDTGLAYRQYTLLECLVPLTEIFEVYCSGSILQNSNGYLSNRIKLSVPVKTRKSLELTPLLILYRRTTDPWEKSAGIEQRLMLYKKTFTDFTIDQELPFSSWRTIRARGKMSFYF